MDEDIIKSAKNVVLKKRKEVKLEAMEVRMQNLEQKIDLILAKMK